MSIPDITLPTPGQYPWGEDLNADLAAMNSGVQIVNEHITENDAALASLEAGIPVAIDTAISNAGFHSIDEFEGDDDSEIFQAAMDHFVGLQQMVTLQVVRPIALTRMITIDVAYINVQFLGGPVDASAIVTGAAITIVNSVPDLIGGNHRAQTGLRLTGPGKDKLGTIGIRFYETTGTVRGLAYWGLDIAGFDRALSFDENAYLLSFYNFHFTSCGTAVYTSGLNVNTGENNKFIGGGIGSCDIGVYNDNPDGNFHFYSTSFDFNGQTAISNRGGIFITDAHIEINRANSGLGTITKPTFVTGPTQTGRIIVHGGYMSLRDRPTGLDYLFETQNTNWGGGIFLNSLTIYNANTKTSFLCGGTGMLYTNNMPTYDGNGSGDGGGAILTSRRNNLLHDGTFQLATVEDAFCMDANATSRVSAPGVTLTIAPGALIVTRPSTSGHFSVDVPIIAGKMYSSWFTMTDAGAGAGSFVYAEQFVAVRKNDARDIPIVLKQVTTANSTISMTTAAAAIASTGVYTTARTNSIPFDRRAPGWATHFRMWFAISSIGGLPIKFSEMGVTGY